MFFVCNLNTTVKPLNKGHVGASHLIVFSREVVHSSEVQIVLTIIMGKWTFGTLKCAICKEVISIVSFSPRGLYCWGFTVYAL